tara:strand:+ start:53 stop:307 length:255 start_codon:yes stop_codon:yes gene_type:complete
MKAIGNYLIIQESKEAITKTSGGLELTEKLKDDIRYRKGIIVSSGPDILKKDQNIIYDKIAGHNIESGDELLKVIQLRDVVAVI